MKNVVPDMAQAGTFRYTHAEERHYFRLRFQTKVRYRADQADAELARENAAFFKRVGLRLGCNQLLETADEIECNFYPGEHL